MIPAGQLLLSVFNEAYAENYPALVVQCIGTAAVAAAGSCGSILMFTGHEGRFLAIVALTVFVRIVSFCIFIPSFGLMGAVWATALSFILMAVLLRQSAVSLTGMDGSVVRLLSRNVLQRTPPLSA
jgi:O-antigen/teichoic acid export membrane protein